jgi:transposase
MMDSVYRCCAGLDVHQKTIAACIRRVDEGGRTREEIRTFGTMTGELLELADWMSSRGVTHVAMESTGVLWKPVFNILEGTFEVLLVNAKHIKQVPGRKTDLKDCQWIAQLLQHGLLRGSFVPDRPQRELRDLTRHRAQLVAEQTRVANRIHKVLEDANVKLAAVASDILGASGSRAG